jgi:hypothetical protein
MLSGYAPREVIVLPPLVSTEMEVVPVASQS